MILMILMDHSSCTRSRRRQESFQPEIITLLGFALASRENNYFSRLQWNLKSRG